ncbi:hypothetical protein CONCODRAFT_77311 [Conidiobolus coronatus NRRL 28638]|uniref:Uncharacterized protein n=1 Tax=Conidiobolus coronatus (strain ATCC 28846 / CBS 209.66 / NRRL 28638) TaxID=796925 RepID=A0A137PEY4_CONC2|nr:hypothetical protein CONCODRAFT_77311 [Conidiobolus coronatus NRRL 28638]|eukprot:KXN73569.1 hypothetical protein CONCODRAFT_77311 [Conidiobolus coronatus NRRL 28638]
MTRNSPVSVQHPSHLNSIHNDICQSTKSTHDTLKPVKKSRKLQIFNTSSHETSKTLVDQSSKSQSLGFKGFIKKIFGISPKNSNKIETITPPPPAKQSFVVKKTQPISQSPPPIDNAVPAKITTKPEPKSPLMDPIIPDISPISSLTPVKRRPPSVQSSPSSSTASLPRYHPIRVTYKISMRKLKEFPNKRPLHQLICIQQVIQNLERHPHLHLSRTPSQSLLERSTSLSLASPTSMTAVCRRTRKTQPSSKSKSSKKPTLDLLIPEESSFSRYPSPSRSSSPKPKSIMNNHQNRSHSRSPSPSPSYIKKQRHISQPHRASKQHFMLDLPNELLEGRYPTLSK